MTRVVAVNGSPSMEKGNTDRILKPFLKGMTEAGSEVDLYYVKQMDVKPCKGDFYCWNENPGTCLIKDEMQTIYPLLRRADILVLAAPVYIPLPGEMQNFLNRLCPLINPVLTKRNGRTRARFRSDVKIKKVVLVSSGGWYEKGNFDTVIRIAKEFAEDVSVEFVGALIRPHSQLLSRGDLQSKKVYEAAKLAGSGLVTTGRISQKRLDAVAKPLISEKEFSKA